MLTELHIEELGVIDELSLVLGPGLTALTGETGTGKTMLVEAINLLVGGRADAAIVRPGACEARVEGRFVVDEEEFVLTRVIPAQSRSRAYLDGRLATVAVLAEVGARLVDLHGQHTHQSLLAPATQRGALDRFGNIDTAPLRAAEARLGEIDAALAMLGGDARARTREIDLLRYQVAEIDGAVLTDEDEEDELDRLEDILAGAVAHREAAATAFGLLSADAGALDQIASASAVITAHAPFRALADRLRAAVAEVDDIAHDLRASSEAIEEDPERLDEIRRRRQLLRDLRRKYGETIADVVTFGDRSSQRLSELEGFEARVQALQRDRDAALRDLAEASGRVGAARRSAAPRLAGAVTSRLRELAMPHADLAITVGEDPGDDVSFLLCANPGSPLLALTRVASGGELARSMLALRLELSQDPSTLVFDEVDAGVGGSAAVAVGRALADLGRRHQVLVVTHLAQVAALASTQIVVDKVVSDGMTRASATPVTGDRRIEEIARMLSGRADSESARAHATDLLEDRHGR